MRFRSLARVIGVCHVYLVECFYFQAAPSCCVACYYPCLSCGILKRGVNSGEVLSLQLQVVTVRSCRGASSITKETTRPGTLQIKWWNLEKLMLKLKLVSFIENFMSWCGWYCTVKVWINRISNKQTSMLGFCAVYHYRYTCAHVVKMNHYTTRGYFVWKNVFFCRQTSKW